MAISSFGRGKRGDETTDSADVKSGGGNLTAFIDQGSDFDGKLTFKDTVRIDGSFQGEICSENTLIVGETGVIEAKIHSNTVIVSGTVVGDITAAHQIVLHKSARVQGDMSAPSLIVEEGASFNGGLSMGRADTKGSASTPLKAMAGGVTESPETSDKAATQKPIEHQNQNRNHQNDKK